MYLRTNGSGLGMVRRRGMGSTIDTCYYYAGQADANGQPICGMSYTNNQNNPALDQETFQAISTKVSYYAQMAALLAGAETPMAAKAALCAVAYFNTLASPADVTANNVGKLNSAANQAVQYVGFGARNNLPCGLIYKWPSLQLLPSESTQITPNQFGSMIPLCDNRTPAGAYDCGNMQKILSGGSLDFVSLIGSGPGGPTGVPQQDPTGAGFVGTVMMNGVLVDAQTHLPVGGSASPTPQPVPRATQQYSSSPAVQPQSAAQYSAGPGPVPLSQPQTSPEMTQPVSITQYASAPGTVQSTLMSPGGAVYNPGAAPAPAAASTSTSGLDLSGITSWVSANPMLAAGLAIGAAFLFMGGKK